MAKPSESAWLSLPRSDLGASRVYTHGQVICASSGQGSSKHWGAHSWHIDKGTRKCHQALTAVAPDKCKDSMKPSDWFRSLNIPTFPFHCNGKNKALRERKSRRKRFLKLVSDEGLTSKIYTELLKLSMRRQTTQLLKISKRSEQTPHETRWQTNIWKDAPHMSLSNCRFIRYMLLLAY